MKMSKKLLLRFAMRKPALDLAQNAQNAALADPFAEPLAPHPLPALELAHNAQNAALTDPFAEPLAPHPPPVRGPVWVPDMRHRVCRKTLKKRDYYLP